MDPDDVRRSIAVGVPDPHGGSPFVGVPATDRLHIRIA